MKHVHSDHVRLEERSLALHRLVAEKVAANPALLEEARANMRRWQAGEGSPNLALAEWEGILEEPIETITALLTHPGERARRLRQSSPFAGILTERERNVIYESYSTRTYYPGGQQNLG
jgi:hypothetical protein